ncbi:uncharacterized protein JCM6883_003456 [Sporobolomyces salmoneus]|uniref:uncharacterized protein n=1 Tax=Sporobolomyces salmoneus TaxID=183962 RepID=UPI00316E9CFF
MTKTDVPTYFKAAILKELGSKYEIEEVEMPELEEDEVLIKVEAAGICHSDLQAHTPEDPDTDIPPIRPLQGGHEGVGRIVKLGSRVEGKQIGDRCGLAFIASNCGFCEACSKGGLTLCPEAGFRGFTVQGTFGEYTVSKAAQAIPIPESLSCVEACPILCAGVTVNKALKLLNPLAGEFIAIPGAGGGLGNLACQYAKCYGLRVIAIDSTAKEEKLRATGAIEHFVDFTKTKNVVEEVIRLSGGGVHHSIVCVAHSGGYTDALKYARVFGKIAAVGLTKFSTHSALLIEKQLTLIGTHVGTPTDAQEALQFVERGLVKCEIEERAFSGEVMEKTFKDLKAGTVVGRVVMRLE